MIILSIQIENLWFKYPTSDWILKNINLNVQEGEFILLCGPTGSGKSTLLYIIAGLVPKYVRGEIRGKILVNNLNPIRGIERLARSVGFVMQHFEDQLLDLKVREEIGLSVVNKYNPNKTDIEKIIDHVLNRFDLHPFSNKYVSFLSFGLKQLVAIASIYALNPDIIILDEPLSQLDNENSNKLISALMRLKAEGKTIIVSEHNIKTFLDIADRLVLIRDGQIILDDYLPVKVSELEKMGLRTRYPSYKGQSKFSNYTLVISDLVCGYESKIVLKWVNLYLRANEIVSIIGPNGSGKTTLGLTILGAVKPIRGSITLYGKPYMIFQDPSLNILSETVWDEVFYPASASGHADANNIAEDLLDRFDLYSQKDEHPFTLSRGERLRLAVASAIASKPQILILDEPTFGQDYLSLRSIIDGIVNYSYKFGFSTLILTCKKEFGYNAADRSYIIKDGWLYEMD